MTVDDPALSKWPRRAGILGLFLLALPILLFVHQPSLALGE